MRDWTIIKANLKRHRGSLGGVFFLMLIVTASLGAVLTVQTNSRHYIYDEMNRLGYGDLTVWASKVPAVESLEGEIEDLPEVDSVGSQAIVYAHYELLDQESDSEGQLITYAPEEYAYRFFTGDLTGYTPPPGTIPRGDIYVSPSLVSMFGAAIGDEIHIIAARNGVTLSFVIRGFFEDPYMGSTMIGMKSFLIGDEDHRELARLSREAGIDSLAREGAMLHITRSPESSLPAAALNGLLNSRTSLPRYTEFVHSREVLAGFMLLLQNIFSGLILAFVLILLTATVIVMGHALGSTIEQDTAQLGILKTAGYTGRRLRNQQIFQYALPVVLGSLAGCVLSPLVSQEVSRMTLTTTGVLIPWDLPLGPFLAGFLVILLILLGFIHLRTRPVLDIDPVSAMQKGIDGYGGKSSSPVKKAGIRFWMALRQLQSGKKHYVSALLIALLLVFFASLIGRMNAWLGPNGEGLMDAFNPADHDLGVQIFSDLSREDVESVITGFSPITDQYELAMESVALNGVDYTANIITDPERFHILRGRAPTGDDEVVLTEFLASDLGLSIGDKVTLSAASGSDEFVITGFYQCANDMGDNFGLSREGYLKIAPDDRRIWCVHYFLEDSSRRIEAMEKLEELYKVDIHVHENAWPGLYGIIASMRNLMLFMYVTAALVILTALSLSGSKILAREQRDLTIYRALGYTVGGLRGSFTLRFLLVSAAGALAGTLLSSLFTDPLVDQVMRTSGISGFSSHPEGAALLFPPAAIILLFTLFAYLISGRISRMELASLIGE